MEPTGSNEVDPILVQIQHISTTTKVYEFHIRIDVPLSKLIRDFYKAADLIPGTIRFEYDDKFINEELTARELEMEDGDMIDAFEYQLGGWYIGGPLMRKSCLFIASYLLFLVYFSWDLTEGLWFKLEGRWVTF